MVGDEGDEVGVGLLRFVGLLGEGDVAHLVVPTHVVDGTKGAFA